MGVIEGSMKYIIIVSTSIAKEIEIVPARDIYHQVVKQGLIKAGWTITHDPYPLAWAKRNLSIDLGAEQLLAAENNDRKIAVEVKSFIRESRELQI